MKKLITRLLITVMLVTSIFVDSTIPTQAYSVSVPRRFKKIDAMPEFGYDCLYVRGIRNTMYFPISIKNSKDAKKLFDDVIIENKKYISNVKVDTSKIKFGKKGTYPITVKITGTKNYRWLDCKLNIKAKVTKGEYLKGRFDYGYEWGTHRMFCTGFSSKYAKHNTKKLISQIREKCGKQHREYIHNYMVKYNLPASNTSFVKPAYVWTVNGVQEELQISE